MRNRDIVIKLGGSVLYEGDQDINFTLLGKVKSWYVGNKVDYHKIVVVTGGGALSRKLQEKMLGNISNQSALHNIAMSVTQTSAELVGGFLGDQSLYIPKKIGDAYEYLLEETPGALISGGLKVGWSTDMDAAVFADILFEKRVYKISNIEYIYDKNPKEFSDAKPIKDMTWGDYFSLFSIKEDDEHIANSNIPVDKECARFCKAKGISFFICGGKNLQEKESIAEVFSDGTLIHP